MKMLLATLLFLTGATATFQAQTAPAAKPDFSGNWKLNVAKSDFGQVPPPSSETNVVTQTQDDFKVAITQAGQVGDQNYTLTFKVGGAETPMAAEAFAANSEFRILSSKAEWKGPLLIVTQKAMYQGGPLEISSRWSLSDDGKVITKITSFSLSQGDYTTTTVYEKN
jgi:hypothetical protein